MAPFSISVLVVDDFEPFRQFLCSKLGNTSDGFVFWEASNGLEAVHKAEQLQPDLILLDIGLPKLNGIAAARRIATVSPGSKILFVSQESSVDVVQEAFRAGASGYIVKIDASRELPTAINTVLSGGRFAGSRFNGHGLTEASEERSPSRRLGRNEKAYRHEAQFYRDDAGLVEGFTEHIKSSLEVGSAVVLLATESHRNGVHVNLQARGVDVFAAIQRGRLFSLDSAEIISSLLVNDHLDPSRFHQIAGDLIAKAARAVNGEHSRVAVHGECAPLLWARGNSQAAVLLEHLWDESVRAHGLNALCGYVLNRFQLEREEHICQEICAKHSAVSRQ